jgi:signal transduction histidine kinase
VDPVLSLTRVPRHPPRSDVIITAALALWALVEAAADPGPHTVILRVLFALAVSLPLLARRRYPFAVATWLTAATVTWALAANRSSPGVMPYPSLLLAAFTVALTERRAVLAGAGGALIAATTAVAILSPLYPGKPTPGNFLVLAVFVGGAWTAGWIVRQRAAQVRSARAEAGERARTAVTQERARIARELHDIVAHSVSIIAVQAGAAEAMLDTDVDGAREHMASVRRTAREAMREMRRLLEVLRTDDAGYAPQPGLDHLPDLLDEVRRAGVPVTLEQTGERPELPAGLELAVFRIVQESLTNVRKHAAGASAQVRLTYGPTEIGVDVVSGGGPFPASNGTGAGHGLVGMRERVRLFGGQMHTGPIDDGGFEVRVRLPRAEESR